MRSRWWQMVQLTGLAVVMVACATNSNMPSDKRLARDAALTWLNAMAEGNGTLACSQMTERARGQLVALRPGTSCAEAVRQLAASLGPAAQAEMRKAKVKEVVFEAPGQAIVSFDAAGQQVVLQKETGRWVISDLTTSAGVGNGGAFPPPSGTFYPAPPP